MKRKEPKKGLGEILWDKQVPLEITVDIDPDNARFLDEVGTEYIMNSDGTSRITPDLLVRVALSRLRDLIEQEAQGVDDLKTSADKVEALADRLADLDPRLA